MADFGQGIKAGAAAATVYLIISVIIAAIGRTFWYPSNFIYAAGLGIHLELMNPLGVILSILTRIVQGIIFGAVFAALYDYLPSTTSVKKGVVLSAFLWILGAVGFIYITPGWPTDGSQTSTVAGLLTVCLSSVGLALVSIISALAFGVLTGFLWDRFRAGGVAEARKGSAALLVSSILGGVLWVSGAVAFLIGVVIRGAPLIEPGPFLWGGILYTSVVFLGLPGWITALAAWRKTKRGESGLKLGVAGGVIMALTGLMLLPGVLAVIGGVLSGGKPATASSTAEIEQ